MLLKKPQYRKFEYLPRFYRPEKDEAETFKRKLEASRRSHGKKRRPVLLWAFLLVFVIYVYLYLSGAFR